MMTARSTVSAGRRPKRWRCAAMSVLLVGGVLAGIGVTTPADAAAPLVTLQRLAGDTRYETATAIAGRYVTDRARDNPSVEVDTVVLTSGEDRHFGYALAVPPLSRKLDAPLLITPPDNLPSTVTRFLENNDIDRVVIVGGPTVVSSSIESELRDDGYDTDRISGGDAYGTAVSVAEQVGSTTGRPGNYDRYGRTVLIATGENFADALALGALAYAGQHPVLLTPQDELHFEVASFLRSADVDHAVIAGGTAAVSRSVEDAIDDLGITVQRLAGDDRYETATEIAEELVDSGNASSCFDGSTVGLAHGRRSPDAIVSGPLLGVRCAPLLLTESDRLDRATQRFLRHDEYLPGDDEGRLRMIVFGGEAAVSADTALNARRAATLESIRARLSGTEGRCTFEVTFNEPVLTEHAQDPAAYRVDGSTLDDATVEAGNDEVTSRVVVILAGARAGDAVPTGCDEPLEADSDIQVAGGVIRAADGNRVVERSTARVIRDNRSPRLTLTAYVAGAQVWVDADETVLLRRSRVEFRRDMPGTTPDLYGESSLSFAGLGAGLVADVPSNFNPLQRGDDITIIEGAVQDLAGNLNSAVRRSPSSDTSSPRVSRVSVTAPEPAAAASIFIDGDDGGTRITDAVEISAKATGSAAGARGNDWTLEVVVEPNWVATRASSVAVSAASDTILLRASDARTLRLVVADLNRHSAFSSRFIAEVTPNSRPDTATLRADSGPDLLTGGASINRLRVEWNEAVLVCGVSGGVDLGDLEVDYDGDGDGDYLLSGIVYDGNVSFVEAPDGSNADTFGSAACDYTPGVRPGTLIAWLRSSVLESLPSTRSRLIVRAGAAVDRANNQARDHVYRGFNRG